MRFFLLSLALITATSFATEFDSNDQIACRHLGIIHTTSAKEAKTSRRKIPSAHMGKILLQILTDAYYIDRTRVDLGPDYASLKREVAEELTNSRLKEFYKNTEYREFFTAIRENTLYIAQTNSCSLF